MEIAVNIHECIYCGYSSHIQICWICSRSQKEATALGQNHCAPRPAAPAQCEKWHGALVKSSLQVAVGGQREILPPSCWRFSFLKGSPTGCHGKGWYDFRAKWKIIEPNGLQLIRNPTFQPSRYCLRNQMEMQKFCILPLLPFLGRAGRGHESFDKCLGML